MNVFEDYRYLWYLVPTNISRLPVLIRLDSLATYRPTILGHQNTIMPSRSLHAVGVDNVATVPLGLELPLPFPPPPPLLPELCDGEDVAAVVLVPEGSAVAPGEHFLIRPVSKHAPLWTPHSLCAGQVQTPSPR